MNIVSWPWPRVIATQYRSLLFYILGTNLLLAELSIDSNGNTIAIPILDLSTATDIDQVTVADFGSFYVLSVLGINKRTYWRNLDIPSVFGLNTFVELAELSCGTVCNYKGQFLGGNVTGSVGTFWESLSSHSIVWSGIGDFTLDPAINITAGSKQLFALSSLGVFPVVYALLPFDDSIIAYTNGGNFVLRPQTVGNTFTYGDLHLPGLGIRSGNHVAGSSNLHGFIDLNNEFWILRSNLQLTNRGYQEFIEELFAYTHPTNDTRVIVSYIPTDDTFFISNGNQCLVINTNGAYMAHQLISSAVVGYDTNIYGTFIDTLDTEARITTDTLDFNSRGLKSIESLLVDSTIASGTKQYASVDHRHNHSASFRSSRRIFSGPTGETRIGVSALDFRLKVVISNYTDSELFGLLTNVKFSDQRFKRGTVPAQYNA